MARENKNTSILWTGGKDCCLAYYRALELGYDVKCLATFVPEGEFGFEAHPVSEILAQAERLQLPLQLLPVTEPFQEAYRAALVQLRDRYDLSTVVTGDIDLVDGFPNWIAECCRGLDLEVLRPLWNENRFSLLSELIEREIVARISFISHPAIPAEWLGREFDVRLIADLAKLEIDLCGENGEYHTMVTGFPLWKMTLKSLLSYFKVEAELDFRGEKIIFRSEERSFALRPEMVVSDKRIVLAIGEPAPSIEGRHVRFLAEKLTDQERAQYLSTFVRFGLTQVLRGKLIRPRLTVLGLPRSSWAQQALEMAGARAVEFID